MISIYLPTDRRHRWDGRRQRQGPVTMARPENLRTDNIGRRKPFLYTQGNDAEYEINEHDIDAAGKESFSKSRKRSENAAAKQQEIQEKNVRSHYPKQDYRLLLTITFYRHTLN